MNPDNLQVQTKPPQAGGQLNLFEKYLTVWDLLIFHDVSHHGQN